ncbi:MAG TPA: hypothetical protein VN924_24590 [Bryobacteraceae bacterium]|nr:hypothetical protein [Bryobacteraceae bacterium]
MVVVTAEVPASVSRVEVATKQLPQTGGGVRRRRAWPRFGDGFAANGRAAILIVPSALALAESNWLVNPRHSDFAKFRVHPPEKFSHDPRFFE